MKQGAFSQSHALLKARRAQVPNDLLLSRLSRCAICHRVQGAQRTIFHSTSYTRPYRQLPIMTPSPQPTGFSLRLGESAARPLDSRSIDLGGKTSASKKPQRAVVRLSSAIAGRSGAIVSLSSATLGRSPATIGQSGAIARRCGATSGRSTAVVGRCGGIAGRSPATVGRSGAVVGPSSAIAGRSGGIVKNHGGVSQNQGGIAGNQNAAAGSQNAASRSPRAIAGSPSTLAGSHRAQHFTQNSPK